MTDQLATHTIAFIAADATAFLWLMVAGATVGYWCLLVAAVVADLAFPCG